MSETEATLLAALIGAAAAIYAGKLAYEAARRQPKDGADAQRSHAVWESLRSIYTQFVLTSKELERFSDADYVGGTSSKVAEVADRLNQLHLQMEIEGPDGCKVIVVAGCVIENLAELRSVAADYARADDPSISETFRVRLRDETRDLRTNIRILQEEVRAELQRDAL
ncbi:hypothetical protein [Streptomyces sp. NPDC001665]